MGLMGLLVRILDCKWDFWCELIGLLVRTVETVDNFLNRTFNTIFLCPNKTIFSDY